MFSEIGTITSVLILILLIWSIVWKGFALWISSKEDKKYWFAALLVFNTFGILEIIYIFLFSIHGKTYISKLKKRRIKKKTKIKDNEESV